MAAILLAFLALLILDGIEATGEKSEKYCADAYSKTFSLNNPTTIIEEFPYMAAIGFKYEDQAKPTIFRCAGVLISEKYVLTAAHCLTPRDATPVQVKLGISNLEFTQNDEKIIQTINISKVVRHPDYKPKFVYNDVGLVELQDPVKLTKDVKPVCLENKKKSSYPSMITANLGILGFVDKPRNKLKKFNVIEYGNAECSTYFSESRKLNDGIVEASLICAGNRQEDPCGESGNPLIEIDPAYGHRLVGISSFGIVCGAKNAPSVFSRVSNYIGWIESIVWP